MAVGFSGQRFSKRTVCFKGKTRASFALRVAVTPCQPPGGQEARLQFRTRRPVGV